MWLNRNKGLKAKGRKEMKREKRVLPISGAFSALWGHKLVGCCVKSLACSMLHPVVERSLWSAMWGHNCRVRTQLMCGEDTTVSSLPNYRLCISSQTPSVVPISPFFSILKILFTPFSFKIFGGRGAIEGQWQDPPVWRQEDEVGKNSHHRATHIIIQRK